ncbi:MAG: N-acetyltransferase [Bacteroidetes bacterium]|nr:N-acetyltransferase [Bacteroidota bacterium]
MTIRNINSNEKGYFKAMEDELEAGIMTYIWDGKDKIIVEHTVVAPLFEGKGVGKQLVMAAVAFAREHKIKIYPQCAYTRSVFEKNVDMRDVLA